MVAFWARTCGPAALLVAPVAWVATEILRAHTLFNFSWCLLGYSQHAHLPVIQIARFGRGLRGVVRGGAVVGALAYAIVEPRRGPAARPGAPGRRLAVGGGAGGRRLWRLRTPVPESGRLTRRARAGLDPPGGEVGPGRGLGATWTATWTLTRGPRPEARGSWSGRSRRCRSCTIATPASRPSCSALARELGVYLLFGNDDRDDGAAAGAAASGWARRC